MTNSLAVNFCGLQLTSPIVLLSGCVGFGEEYTRIAGFSNRDAGAIVLKGTTRNPRLGNPPHRLWETPEGMLNAIGLQNPGVDKVVDEILPGLDFSETRFLANVCGSTIEEYAEVARRFHDSPIDGMEIKVGEGSYEQKLARLFELIDEIRSRPIEVDYIDLRFANRVIVKPVAEVIQ